MAMAERRRRPSREFDVYEMDSRTGLRVPAKKPTQWAVSSKEAISRVRYAAYPGLSYRDLARKGVILVAEEENPPAKSPEPKFPVQDTLF